MADNCCFSSHFLSNEWDLAHISGGGDGELTQKVYFLSSKNERKRA